MQMETGSVITVSAALTAVRDGAAAIMAADITEDVITKEENGDILCTANRR